MIPDLTGTDLRRRAVAWVVYPVLVVMTLTACSGTAPTETGSTDATGAASADPASAPAASATTAREESTMIVTVQGQDFLLELADNSSAQALTELVGNEGLEIAMEDYGGFEKVGPLPQQLPTNDEQIITAPGDVILYQGDKLVIYYGTNSWSLTRLGRITGMDGEQLHRALGDGDVTVTLRKI